MPRRHAQGLRRHPRLPRARRAAHHLCGDGTAHRDQAAACARREGRRLHGRRLCARLGQTGHLHGAGDRRAQSRRRPARRLAGPFARDRHDRWPRAEDQIPQSLSGDRRHAGVRAGDKIQRHDRRRGAVSRHGAASVPYRGDRLSRARCICNSAATRDRSMPKKPTWSRWSSRNFPACRRFVRSPTRRACARR